MSFLGPKSSKKALLFSSEQIKENNLKAAVTYSVTWKRYFMLVLLALINFCNLIWLWRGSSSSRIRNEIKEIHHPSDFQLYLLEVLFSVWYLPGSIIAVLLYTRFSLRICILIATFLQTIGSSIMILTVENLVFIYIGNVFWAIVYQIIVIGAPLFATNWFEDSKRAIVIAFIYIITFLTSDHSLNF